MTDRSTALLALSRAISGAWLFTASVSTSAETQAPSRPDSLDGTATYILGTNSIIERSAKLCLPMLERKDSPDLLRDAWQQRNARYYSAAIKYMYFRLDEVELNLGKAERDSLASRWHSVIEKGGDDTVAELTKFDTRVSCKRLIGMIEAGDMEIAKLASKYSRLDEVNALMDYAGSSLALGRGTR